MSLISVSISNDVFTTKPCEAPTDHSKDRYTKARYFQVLYGVEQKYRQSSNMSHTLVSNKIVDLCLPALLQLHPISWLNTWLQSIGQSQLQNKMRNI